MVRVLGTEEFAFLATTSVARKILILKRLRLKALTEITIGQSTVTATKTLVEPNNPTQKSGG